MSRAIVLMYHHIGIPPRGRDPLGLYVSPGMFRFQMWHLKTAGFTVVPLSRIGDFIAGKAVGKRVVSITFDDGYQDFFDNAFPILREYRFPSTVFLVAGLIGKENSWEAEDGASLMDWDAIHRLKEEGVTFGSHTLTHPFLSRLPADRRMTELADSKTFLEDRLKLPVDSFCYPYGDYDSAAVAAVKEAGYSLALTTKRGLVHKGDDPLRVRRSFIRSGTNPFLFFLRLHSGYEDRKRAAE